MKSPIAVALLSLVPVLILAGLAPGWLPQALTFVMIVESGFLLNMSKRMVQWKREHGPIPFRLRQPMIIWLVGLLCYAAIALGSLGQAEVRALAIGGAFSFALSKLWLGKGPFWPCQGRAAPTLS